MHEQYLRCVDVFAWLCHFAEDFQHNFIDEWFIFPYKKMSWQIQSHYQTYDFNLCLKIGFLQENKMIEVGLEFGIWYALSKAM